MIERRYENDKKVYVKVVATFSPDGKLQPVAFGGEVCQAASLKTGGAEIRYTCIALGREINLFFGGKQIVY